MTVQRRRTGGMPASDAPTSAAPRRLLPAMRALLLGEPYAGLEGELTAFLAEPELAAWGEPDGDAAALWRLHGPRLVDTWAADHPGTRPPAWWRWDAPRWPAGAFRGWWYDGHLPLPRERLGGRGRPAHEVDATFPEYRAGLPVHWASISRKDPPRFESQATYLRRLGLLLPGEARRLSDRDFVPELVVPDGTP